MRRRDVVAGAAALAAISRAYGQQRVNEPRIGCLILGSATSRLGRRNVDAFRQGLTDVGYVEGRTIGVDYRFAEGDFDRLPVLASELAQRDLAVIVAGPTLAAVAASRATRVIPIVMISVGDPVRLGLIASLGHPGGNVTGLAFTVGTDVFTKALELLHDMMPTLERVGVLSNAANPSHSLIVPDLKAAAGALRIALVPIAVSGPDDLEEAFLRMSREGARGVVVLADIITSTHAALVAQLAAKHQLASVHQFRDEVEAGGLMSYGHSLADQWRQAGPFVDRLLKGASAADLPVQQPTRFDFVINMNTARALGIAVPVALLARADEVID